MKRRLNDSLNAIDRADLSSFGTRKDADESTQVSTIDRYDFGIDFPKETVGILGKKYSLGGKFPGGFKTEGVGSATRSPEKNTVMEAGRKQHLSALYADRRRWS